MPSAEPRWENRSEGIAFTLLIDERAIPPEEWAVAAPANLLPAVGRLLALVEESVAVVDGAAVLVSHAQVASWDAITTQRMRLPPPSPFILNIRHAGTIDQPQFRFEIQWLRANGQPVLGAQRSGCILRVGLEDRRLPSSQFELAEGIDAFNGTPANDLQARLAKFASFQAHLPEAAQDAVRVSGYLQQTRVAHAGAFSLAVRATARGFEFDPVLFGRKPHGEPWELGTDETPLLPAEYQDGFAHRYAGFGDCQSRYALGHGWYAVLDPTLQLVLTAVRKVQRGDREQRREFLRNPRAFIRTTLGDACADDALEALFVETRDYSERVRDVGLHQPTVVPWVVRPSQPWLPPEQFGLMVEGQPLPLTREQIAPLRELVATAVDAGETVVEHEGQRIPVTPETLAALDELANQSVAPWEPTPPDAAPLDESSPAGRHVLQIELNFENIGFRRVLHKRQPPLDVAMPAGVKTALKQHQVSGIEWLQGAWRAGCPGVLLADDMGLGKTLQALAFLLWLRDAMRVGQLPQQPILIVAPTGLLRNWEEETARHLEAPGLGEPLRAHGAGLRALLRSDGSLDAERLADAQWILTTYETLRDHQLSFGRVRVAAMVLDEVQKTKTPGTLTTHAVKAMHADFTVAMTGTPIENRLADLWCILDTAEPGRLGDLKSFSARYEKDATPELLRELKVLLTAPESGSPAIMLRRMKIDHLKGLPQRHEHMEESIMPPPQAAAYAETVRRAHGKGVSMLETLHHLRSISLHPEPPDSADADGYIAASARLTACFRFLDQIASHKEKALIFLESLDMQSFLIPVLQRRYGLSRPPGLINGTVDGGRRQQRVNEFQAAPPGFDVMLLSPRAGGVGLTLTAANHVIHLSRWWNPAVEDQCTDRIYRIGQSREVHVYYPLAVHPEPLLGEHSFDRKLHALLMRKRDLSREMLLPPVDAERDAGALFQETVGGVFA